MSTNFKIKSYMNRLRYLQYLFNDFQTSTAEHSPENKEIGNRYTFNPQFALRFFTQSLAALATSNHHWQWNTINYTGYRRQDQQANSVSADEIIVDHR